MKTDTEKEFKNNFNLFKQNYIEQTNKYAEIFSFIEKNIEHVILFNERRDLNEVVLSARFFNNLEKKLSKGVVNASHDSYRLYIS